VPPSRYTHPEVNQGMGTASMAREGRKGSEWVHMRVETPEKHLRLVIFFIKRESLRGF
jgi:hypothetical protein